MLTPQLTPLETKGQGDCAFHAIFGEWDGIQISCPNVKNLREKVAACIKTAQAGDKILTNTIEGIQDIVMANRNMGGHRIQALKDQYRTFDANNQQAMDQSWFAFEALLQAYPAIVAHIHQFNLNRGTFNINLKTEFDTCYNEEDEFKEQILAIPELSSVYNQYQMHANNDFWHSFTWNNEIIEEYAECVQQEGTFTLPTDLDTIARVFNVTIAYHTKQIDHSEVIRTEDYNPDASNPIPICFNGSNHYERMADPKENKSIPAPSKKKSQKTSTTVLRSKLSTKTEANAPSDSSDKISEVKHDKIEDVKTLFQLFLKLEAFIEKPKDLSQTSFSDVNQLLKDISESSTNVKWNNESGNHIRNIYGKVFYKTGKINKEYIDFERLALPHRFQDVTVLKNINEILFLHLERFIPDIQCLRNNILIVLKREFRKHKHLNDPDQCRDIVEYVAARSIEQKQLLPLNIFQTLIDIHYDPLLIQKICQPDLINAFNEIDPKDKPLQWRYTFARVLTLIGQAAKDLSPTISERYARLPLKALVDLRNAIAHGNVHRKHIINKNPSSSPLFQTIAQTHLRELQEQLKQIPSNVLTNDPISVLNAYRQSFLTMQDDPESVEKEPSQVDRIQALKKREVSLKNHQIRQQSQSTTKKGNQGNKDTVNEKRYRERIAILESKEKTETLTEKDKMALTSIRKELERLERRKSSATPTFTNKKWEKSPEEIEQELEKIAAELDSLKSLSVFDELLTIFKKSNPKTHSKEKQTVVEGMMPSSSSGSSLSASTIRQTKESSPLEEGITIPKIADRSNTLEYLLKNLRKEYKRMDNMRLSSLQSGRDFAKEHCMSVIGQLMREIKQCKERLFQKIFNQNQTIRQAFVESISTRNQKLMHDPFNDHTSALNLTIRDFTLPLSFDLKALQTILRHESTQEEIHTISSLIGIYRTIGDAYFRLHLLEEAEKYFIESLNLASPSNYVHFLIEKFGGQPLGLPEKTIPLGGAQYAVEYQHRTITFEGEHLWIHHRLTTLTHLAYCQIQHAKYSNAIENLEECLIIYRNSKFENAPSQSEIQALYYVAQLGNNPQKGKELLQEFTQRYPDDIQGKTQLLLTVTRDKFDSGDFQEGLALINQMEPDENTPKPFIANLKILHGLLLAGLANQHAMILTSGQNRSTELLPNPDEIREKAITIIRDAYTYYQEHVAEFKLVHGDKIGALSEQLNERYPSIMRDHACSLVQYPERQQESYELIHEAIKIHNTHLQDTSLSFIALGMICNKIYKTNHEQQYLEKGLQTYSDCTIHQDIAMQALGYLGIGSLLQAESQHLEYFKQRSSEILMNLRNAFYYISLIPEEKRSAMIKRNIPALYEVLDDVEITQAQYIDNDDITIRAAVHVRLGTIFWIKSQFSEAESNFVTSFEHEAIGYFGLARDLYLQIPEEQKTDCIREEEWYIEYTLSDMLERARQTIDHQDQAIRALAHVRSGAVLLSRLQGIQALDYFTLARQHYSQIPEGDKSTDDQNHEEYIQSMQEMLLNFYDQKTQHPDTSIRAAGYTGKGAAFLSLSHFSDALENFTCASHCYSQIPEEEKSDLDRESEKFIYSKCAEIQLLETQVEL